MTKPLSKTKLVFMGGGKFGVPALLALHENFNVVLVVTNPEKPVGRKQVPVASAVEVKAHELGLPVKIVEKFDTKTIEEIRQANPEIMVVVDFGKIIPKVVIDIPPKGTVNIHPSKLPKYRGASPLQSAILSGEKTTAISIMLIDHEMDHGPILAQKEVKIKANETYGELYERLSNEYPSLLLEALQAYLAGNLKPQEQDHAQATFTKLLKRQDGAIDWTKPAEEIINMVHAFDPWPGTFTKWNSKSLKIFQAVASEKTLDPGKVLIEDKRLFIGTGSTALEILELQLEGKSKLSAATFVNGNQAINGAQL